MTIGNLWENLSRSGIKKVLVWGLITAFAVQSLCGCEKRTGADEELTPITFTFFNADGRENHWADPVALKITEKTGVTLKTEYPSDSMDNGVALLVATKEYPDLIFAKGDADMLIRNEAFIDMAPLIEQYGPNIKKLYGDDYENLKFSKSNPSIYQLCSDQVQDEVLSTGGTAQLQWAVLKYFDYKIPKTLNEFSDMIRKYKSKYDTIDNKQTIGISISVADWHWYTTLSDPSGYIANGSSDDGQWIVDESNNVFYKHAAKGQREYFRWLNGMYNEGLLDPDFATQKHEDYLQKICEGRVLGLLDADWDYSSAESILKAQGKYERTYAGLPVTMNSSIKCSALDSQNLAIGWGVGITTSCKDPVRAVKFLDYLCSEEGQILIHWGIEGVNYFYDENGVRYRTEEEIKNAETDVNYGERTGVGEHTYPFPAYGNCVLDSTGNYFTTASRERIINEYNIEQKAAIEAWGVSSLTDIFPQRESFEKREYSPLWAKVLPTKTGELLNKLDAVAWPGLIDCIVCPESEFDSRWVKLQEDLIEAGLDEAEKLMTKAVKEEISYRRGE